MWNYSRMEGTFTRGTYSHVEGTFTCGSYSCVEGEFTCGSYTYIHMSHVQLTYMVINVQDGGGDI